MVVTGWWAATLEDERELLLHKDAQLTVAMRQRIDVYYRARAHMTQAFSLLAAADTVRTPRRYPLRDPLSFAAKTAMDALHELGLAARAPLIITDTSYRINNVREPWMESVQALAAGGDIYAWHQIEDELARDAQLVAIPMSRDQQQLYVVEIEADALRAEIRWTKFLGVVLQTVGIVLLLLKDSSHEDGLTADAVLDQRDMFRASE